MDAAVRASSLILATKTLSTMLYMDCTSMETMMGCDMFTTSFGTGMVPILFSLSIKPSFKATKNACNQGDFHSRLHA